MFTTWWALAIELAWKGTVVLAVAGVTNLLLWRASAAVRHTIWAIALGSLLALPLLDSILPAWGPAKVVYISATPAVGIASTIPHRDVHPTASAFDARAVAFVFWSAGVFICFARWKRAIAKVVHMQKNAGIMPDYDGIAHEVAVQLGLRNRPRLLRSSQEIMPLAAGIRYPVVLLPASAFDWSRERLRAVLLHEMAHIRRRDSVTQALAELALCLYWFHPLVWLAVHCLRVERERASDDLVLRAGTVASDYASLLLGLARSLKPELSAATVSVMGAHLETRIRAILNPRANRRAMSRGSVVAACMLAACLVLPVAAMRPQAANPGVVAGSVYDPAGARVPGATIIASSSSGQELKTTTDQEGKFTIGPLTGAGTWQLIVLAPGFVQHIQRVDKDHFDITLDIGQIQENVVVHGKGTPATAGPHRVRVGGNVVPAKLVYKIDPEYPADAQSRGIHGDVVLRAVISVQGGVLSLTSISAPDPELAEAAMKAVREWRYQPSLLNGEPVETVITITVNFDLEP